MLPRCSFSLSRCQAQRNCSSHILTLHLNTLTALGDFLSKSRLQWTAIQNHITPKAIERNELVRFLRQLCNSRFTNAVIFYNLPFTRYLNKCHSSVIARNRIEHWRKETIFNTITYRLQLPLKNPYATRSSIGFADRRSPICVLHNFIFKTAIINKTTRYFVLFW